MLYRICHIIYFRNLCPSCLPQVMAQAGLVELFCQALVNPNADIEVRPQPAEMTCEPSPPFFSTGCFEGILARHALQSSFCIV